MLDGGPSLPPTKGNFVGMRSIAKYMDTHELCRNGRTDRDTIWDVNSDRSKKALLDGRAHLHNVQMIEPSMCGSTLTTFY